MVMAHKHLQLGYMISVLEHMHLLDPVVRVDKPTWTVWAEHVIPQHQSESLKSVSMHTSIYELYPRYVNDWMNGIEWPIFDDDRIKLKIILCTQIPYIFPTLFACQFDMKQMKSISVR